MHKSDASVNSATDVASRYVMEVIGPFETENMGWLFALCRSFKNKIKGQSGERAEKNDQFLRKKIKRDQWKDGFGSSLYCDNRNKVWKVFVFY